MKKKYTVPTVKVFGSLSDLTREAQVIGVLKEKMISSKRILKEKEKILPILQQK